MFRVASLFALTLCSLPLWAKDNVASYCRETGGKVERMPAMFSSPVGRVEGVSRLFCTFTPSNGFLVMGLESFASSVPNVAASYAKTLPELADDSPLLQGQYSNPSLNVCKNLGGASISFVANGGFSNALGESDVCVFGDGSMISAWSLIYMANHREGYDAIKAAVRSEPLQLLTSESK